MNLNELENELRKNKAQGDDSFSTDELWQRVQPHIPQHRSNHRSKYLLGLLALILLCGGYAVLQISDDDVIDKDAAVTIRDKASTQKLKGDFGETASIPHNNEGIYESRKTSEMPNEIADLQRNADLSDRRVNSQKQELDQSYINDGIKFYREISGVNNADLSGRNTTSEIIEYDSQASASLQDAGLIQSTINTSELDGGSNAVIPKIDSPSAVPEQRSFLKTQLIPGLLNTLTLDEKKFEMPRSPYAQKRNRRMYIELGGGLFLPMRNLTLTNPDFKGEYDHRLVSESILEAWSVSLEFGYQIIPNLGLRIGLDCTTINERSQTTLTNSEKVQLTNTVIGNYIRVDGTVEPILGDIEVERTTTTETTRANSFRFINVPVELVYSHRIGGLDLELGLGAANNIALKATGYWHPNDAMEYSLDGDSSNYLQGRVGWSVQGSAGMSYRLNPVSSIYGRIKWSSQLNSIAMPDYGIEQKYSLIGTEIGLRTHF